MGSDREVRSRATDGSVAAPHPFALTPAVGTPAPSEKTSQIAASTSEGRGKFNRSRARANQAATLARPVR
jgi:hypothetical protein